MLTALYAPRGITRSDFIHYKTAKKNPRDFLGVCRETSQEVLNFALERDYMITNYKGVPVVAYETPELAGSPSPLGLAILEHDQTTPIRGSFFPTTIQRMHFSSIPPRKLTFQEIAHMFLRKGPLRIAAPKYPYSATHKDLVSRSIFALEEKTPEQQSLCDITQEFLTIVAAHEDLFTLDDVFDLNNSKVFRELVKDQPYLEY